MLRPSIDLFFGEHLGFRFVSPTLSFSGVNNVKQKNLDKRDSKSGPSEYKDGALTSQLQLISKDTLLGYFE
jgi:hypothetical protein